MMRLFKTVVIVGTGLMGGSIAQAIKKKRLAGTVIGIARTRKTVEAALRMRCIDRGSQDLRDVRGADFLILATPVITIMELAPVLARQAPSGCIVTDVGSTKEEIVLRLERLFPFYVGSHPLAGLEKSGVAFADRRIFEGAACIMTPTARTRPGAFAKVKQFWNALGMKVAVLSAARHDRILSSVSHLPHAVAFSLIKSVPRAYFPFSAGGLADTTRIAASDPRLWADVFLSNARHLRGSIGEFERTLAGIKKALSKRDRASLIRILEEARRKREALR